MTQRFYLPEISPQHIHDYYKVLPYVDQIQKLTRFNDFSYNDIK